MTQLLARELELGVDLGAVVRPLCDQRAALELTPKTSAAYPSPRFMATAGAKSMLFTVKPSRTASGFRSAITASRAAW